MRRRLLNVLTALSLLLCVAVIGLWVRSYWAVDHIGFSRPGWSLFMEYGGGQFRFEHARALPDSGYVRSSGLVCRRVDRADGPLRAGMKMPGSRSHLDKGGFWIVTGERWGDVHHAAFFPAWFLAMLTLALPGSRAVTRLCTVARASRTLPRLRVRSPRHAQPLPRVRHAFWRSAVSGRACPPFRRAGPAVIRHLVNFLTALSLLCVAVVLLWWRRYSRAELVQLQRSHLIGSRQYQVIHSLFAADGLVRFGRDVEFVFRPRRRVRILASPARPQKGGSRPACAAANQPAATEGDCPHLL